MTIGFFEMRRAWSAAGVGTAALLLGLIGPAAAGGDGKDLLRAHCSGCHHETAGQFERISSMRKTPEGWLMTLSRMRQVHRVVLDDQVRDAIVRYLSDTQGLAPIETYAARFALERRPNATDLDLGTDINSTCGQCHSLATVSLQRRDAEEWRKLAEMHVSHDWPSLTQHKSVRNRTWLEMAKGAVATQLAVRYPLNSAAWSKWQNQPVGDLSGSWAVAGHVPGGHDFHGTEKIERDAGGEYRATYQLTAVDGTSFQGESKAVLYTGYEWRGSAEVGGRALREVYMVGPSGNRLAGRWFDPDHPEDGGDWVAYRDNGKGRIFDILPQALRTGTTTDVVIVGTGLEKQPGPLSLGEGTVVSNEQRDSHSIRARVQVANDARPGARNATVGSVSALGIPVIYGQVDQIDVTPKIATAQLGVGKLAPVWAQFEAIGWTRLPNGTLLSLGPLPVDWSVAPFDSESKQNESGKLAGQLDQRGRFLPAGPAANAVPKHPGANVESLWVVAQSRDANHTEGRARLVVTEPKEGTKSIY